MKEGNSIDENILTKLPEPTESLVTDATCTAKESIVI
jgi:hypothetical protein